MRQQSNFSTLCRGRIMPKDLNHEMVVKFMESVEQFERIMNDTGYIKLHRLNDEDLIGTETSSGLIENICRFQWMTSLAWRTLTCRQGR